MEQRRRSPVSPASPACPVASLLQCRARSMALLAARLEAQLRSLSEGFAQPCTDEAAATDVLKKMESIGDLLMLVTAAIGSEGLPSAQQASLIRWEHAPRLGQAVGAGGGWD